MKWSLCHHQKRIPWKKKGEERGGREENSQSADRADDAAQQNHDAPCTAQLGSPTNRIGEERERMRVVRPVIINNCHPTLGNARPGSLPRENKNHTRGRSVRNSSSSLQRICVCLCSPPLIFNHSKRDLKWFIIQRAGKKSER